MSELEIIDTTKGARLIPAGSEPDTPVFVLVLWEEVEEVANKWTYLL